MIVTARRLAAILAADVAGYSRLMGEDEAGTAMRVRERREAAADFARAFGGRLVKTTGDGVLLEFPSVVAGVECAIVIQKMMAERNAALAETHRILYRIGVNVGDVLVDNDDIIGDGVNVSARLEALSEPGGVCLSNSAFEQVRGRIQANFADMGDQPLKNIALPVRIHTLSPDAIAGAKVEVPKTPNIVSQPQPGRERRQPPRLSIVVLPFANVGGDPGQEVFVDGVTESLTTDLSRISGAVVIGRSTAFAYKGQEIDLRRLGRELAVRYALEGSVQRSGNGMRVNVQLIETETGAHVWAERFGKPIADLFEMQDEIVSRLANQLQAELVGAEARRAETAPNPDSMDFYFQGMALLNQGIATGRVEQARAFFRLALELAPDNPNALVGDAIADIFQAATFIKAESGGLSARAEDSLTRALVLAPNHAGAHCWLGRLRIGSMRAPQGIASCERALALDCNLASAHAFIGLGKNAIGCAEETEAHVLEALRLSPRDALAYRWMVIAGSAKLALADDEGAAAWLSRSIESNRTSAIGHFLLAAALVHLGQVREAALSVRAGFSLDPAFTIRLFRLGAASDNPVFLARRERIYDGLRRAGIPES